MVIWSETRLGKYRDDEYREDASHFIKELIENEIEGFEYLTKYFCLEKSSYIYYKSKFSKFSKTYGMRQKEKVRIIIVCTINHVIMRSATWVTWWQPLISFERFFRGWNLLRARLIFRTLARIYIRVCLSEIKEVKIKYVCQTLISMRC